MLAHDCAATACWHYAEEDAFVLRARLYIKKGQEITISYVGDDDLFKSTNGTCPIDIATTINTCSRTKLYTLQC